MTNIFDVLCNQETIGCGKTQRFNLDLSNYIVKFKPIIPKQLTHIKPTTV